MKTAADPVKFEWPTRELRYIQIQPPIGDITPTGGMGYAAQWVIPPGGSVPCQVVVTG